MRRLPPFSLKWVEAAIRRSNPRKATGLDGVGAAAWRAGGEPTALLAMTVLSASSAAAACPLLMKGGRIQDVWKGSGLRADPSNSRGILVQTQLGKLHGAALKDDLDDVYMSAVADT